ncbi:MAG: hypothetical protein U0354_04475 [Candidatus Sericytochromatia bacterium]
MFGNILKSLKNSVAPSVKTMASNNFLNAINNLDEFKTAKENAIKASPSEDKYVNLFNEAILIFFQAVEDIETDYGYELLQEAAEKFSEAIEIRKSKAEPYFYLSYIFLILGDLSSALKYFKVVEFMKPDLNGLATLKSKLESAINYGLNKQDESNNTLPKPKTSSIVSSKIMSTSSSRPLNKTVQNKSVSSSIIRKTK